MPTKILQLLLELKVYMYCQKNMISPGGFLEITIYATYWFEGHGVILEQEVCSKTPISPIKLKVIETVAVIMQNA